MTRRSILYLGIALFVALGLLPAVARIHSASAVSRGASVLAAPANALDLGTTVQAAPTTEGVYIDPIPALAPSDGNSGTFDIHAVAPPQGLGAVTAQITFDTRVIGLTSCALVVTGGPTPGPSSSPSDANTCNQNASPGPSASPVANQQTLIVSTATQNGCSTPAPPATPAPCGFLGDSILARATFHAVGAAGATTPLTVTLTDFSDSQTRDQKANATNVDGRAIVRLQGDFTGDNSVDIFDVICLLNNTDPNFQGTANCPRVATSGPAGFFGDLTNDGSVDIFDAICLLNNTDPNFQGTTNCRRIPTSATALAPASVVVAPARLPSR